MLRALGKCYGEFLNMIKLCFVERSKMCLQETQVAVPIHIHPWTPHWLYPNSGAASLEGPGL